MNLPIYIWTTNGQLDNFTNISSSISFVKFWHKSFALAYPIQAELKYHIKTLLVLKFQYIDLFHPFELLH